MKNLKLFFALTLLVLFVVSSCNKEDAVTGLEGEKAAFENTVDENEMVLSSELYSDAELNIEALRATDKTNARGVLTCPEISSLEIQHWTPGSCLVQLATETRRSVGQEIRIVHYVPGSGVEYDYTFTGTYGNDCSLTGLNFSIPYTTLSSGTVVSYVMIMDGPAWQVYDYVVWSNC